jgi:ADP-ribose pyrophosphatase YjhB (NUDIX family)
MTDRRHCPFCGKGNRRLPGALHRRCPACGETDWVNPAPAVGVAILRNNLVLLSKRARAPKQGQWDLVGGFLEPEETPFEAAHREVLEETGCRLAEVRVEQVQPGVYDGQPTLNFLAVGRIEGEPRANDDSLELAWFPLDRVPRIAWPHEAAFVARLRSL